MLDPTASYVEAYRHYRERRYLQCFRRYGEIAFAFRRLFERSPLYCRRRINTFSGLLCEPLHDRFLDLMASENPLQVHSQRVSPIPMNRLISSKILLVIAVWLLPGGLSFADTFDLADELQRALPNLAQALEPDLDEVREQFDHTAPPMTARVSSELASAAQAFDGLPWFDRPSPVAFRPLHERLRTFRI